ncbi:hypothetical protein SNE40_003247 [Patella caerulea]|uniref:DUF19 domain-containing protein n=1 Tax=Patella caerulea TaxID=87958 RepID=A0AAN8K7L2_PATCE
MLKFTLNCLLCVLCIETVFCCFQTCTTTFNSELTIATQHSDPDLLAKNTCRAIKTYSDCMKNLVAQCRGLIETTIQTVDLNYNNSCHENASAIVAKAMECTQKAGQCMQNFNFSNSMNGPVDPAVLCNALDVYTNCTEILMLSADCSPYMGQPALQLENMRNQYAQFCSPAHGGVPGSNAAHCFNQTMTCYDAYSIAHNPMDFTKDVEGMCSSMNHYINCVANVTSNMDCQPYATKIQSGVYSTVHQHRSLCGADGGKTAGRCFKTFESCYAPFNQTYIPASASHDYPSICRAVNNLVTCSNGIDQDCMYYLGKALIGVERMQNQYSYRCAPENEQAVACKALDNCTQEMIKSMMVKPTRHSSSSPMCSSTIDQLFPCVERAFDRCGITETGVTIKKVSTVSRDYCLNFASDPKIHNCQQIIMCQMNENYTMSDPLQMTNSTFWCGYYAASIDCIHDVIQKDMCNGIVPMKAQYLSKVVNIQKQVTEVCTVRKVTTYNKEQTDNNSKWNSKF